MIKKIASTSTVNTAKNIIIGFLLGTVIVLWLSILRFCIESEAVEKGLEPPAIKREVPEDYEKARNMPILPLTPLTAEELLSLASIFPDLFTDEELVMLLMQ